MGSGLFEYAAESLERHFVGLNFEFSIGRAAVWRDFNSTWTTALQEKCAWMEAYSALWSFGTKFGICSWTSKNPRTDLIEWAWSLQIM